MEYSVYLSASEEVDVVSKKKKKQTYEELVEAVTGKSVEKRSILSHVGTSDFPCLHTEVLRAWV